MLSALIEGCSIRSVVRMTGTSKKCVMRLLIEAGAVALRYQDEVFRNLNSERIQVDEMWAFIGAKQKNVTPAIAAKNPSAGDIWLWVAIDADTKIVPTWLLGNRDGHTARVFIKDLKDRLANRIQLTSDGLKYYFHAVAEYFDDEVDYAQLHKIYGAQYMGDKPANVRYSPAECLGCEKKPRIGRPDPEHISTSFVERQNLSVRMNIRRYTRLTNAFSRKIENHSAAVALYYFSYNFIRIHRTLRCTPAMAAGITDRLWEVSDLVALLEAGEQELKKAA